MNFDFYRKFLITLLFVIFQVISVVAYACPIGKIIAEQGNYRIVRQSQISTNQTEAILHYDFLYFGDINLGAVNKYFISPDNVFAIYQHFNEILLFDSTNFYLKKIHVENLYNLKSVTWDMTESLAIVDYFDTDFTSSIKLSNK